MVKRYYDVVYEINEEVYLLVLLSLLKLRVKSVWNMFINGVINSIRDELGMDYFFFLLLFEYLKLICCDIVEKKYWLFCEWINNFF